MDRRSRWNETSDRCKDFVREVRRDVPAVASEQYIVADVVERPADVAAGNVGRAGDLYHGSHRGAERRLNY